jgi:mono/diheme cytochrome c family protein
MASESNAGRQDMAVRSGFDWSAFFTGALALLLLAIVLGAAVVFGGLYPVGASTGDPPGVGPILGASRDHAVERSASGLKAPTLTQADILSGGSHFKGMCQECHGGPGATREDFAGAMNPTPPDLAEATGDLSTEQVFWIAKNGLKMTGMPAFGKTDSDEMLWKVAAFVKTLPKVSPGQYAALPNAHGKQEAGHDSD